VLSVTERNCASIVVHWSKENWLWSPYVIGQTIIFSSCFFLSSFFLFFLVSKMSYCVVFFVLHSQQPNCGGSTSGCSVCARWRLRIRNRKRVRRKCFGSVRTRDRHHYQLSSRRTGYVLRSSVASYVHVADDLRVCILFRPVPRKQISPNTYGTAPVDSDTRSVVFFHFYGRPM